MKLLNLFFKLTILFLIITFSSCKQKNAPKNNESVKDSITTTIDSTKIDSTLPVIPLDSLK
jgi:PBP1b-binding outer membrane lipoprotein LpoB